MGNEVFKNLVASWFPGFNRNQPSPRLRLTGQLLEGSNENGDAPDKGPIGKFTRWEVVDLANFKVKLKAEFQGSNRNMYRAEAIVASSTKD